MPKGLPARLRAGEASGNARMLKRLGSSPDLQVQAINPSHFVVSRKGIDPVMATRTIQYPYFHEEHNGASAYSHHDAHTAAPIWSQWYNDTANAMMPVQTFWPPANSVLHTPLRFNKEEQRTASPLTASPTSFICPDSLQTDSTPAMDPSSSIAESDEYYGSTRGNNKRRKASGSPRRDPQRVHSQPPIKGTSKDIPRDAAGHRKSVSEPIRRERNRTAAAKCRAKGKIAEEELKESQRAERERNVLLRAQFEELSNETLLLKHKLLSHSECSHPVIDKYLMREADKISRGYSHG